MVLMRLRLASLGARVFAEQLVIFGDLLQEELLLVIARHADPLKDCYG